MNYSGTMIKLKGMKEWDMVTGVRNVKSGSTDKSWEFKGLNTNHQSPLLCLDYMIFNQVTYNSQTQLSQMAPMCFNANTNSFLLLCHCVPNGYGTCHMCAFDLNLLSMRENSHTKAMFFQPKALKFNELLNLKEE